jgi:hypothetical protein
MNPNPSHPHRSSNLSVFCAIVLATLAAPGLPLSASGGENVLFEETFDDPALPAWLVHPGNTGASVGPCAGAGGARGFCFKSDAPASAGAVVNLPARKAAGKVVIVEAMLKADGVRSGVLPGYNSAKLMLKWSGPQSGEKWTRGDRSDFSGTFDWTQKRYAVQLPPDITKLTLHIGIERAEGAACYSGIRVWTDPAITSVEEFDRARETAAREKFAAGRPALTHTPGGAFEAWAGDTRIPRGAWDERVIRALLDTPVAAGADGDTAAAVLSRAFAAQAAELTTGFDSAAGAGAADRACEIAGLRVRAATLAGAETGAGADATVTLTAALPEKTSPVNTLIFGNNINWGEFDLALDHATGGFKDEFLARVRPMSITFLRYPGGCNADTFDWRQAVGPMDRRPAQTYYNRSHRAPVFFGVDEFLRFCERENITPVITTAFLKDTPEKLAAAPAPRAHPWVPGYLKTAPERIRLAADWVEYCNGGADTPMGRLRAQNGHPAPYNVIHWEVGNETWGADPVGSCSADDYAAAFPAYVKAMKARDPKIKAGLNGHVLRDWMDTVLRVAGTSADFVQIHTYAGGGLIEPEPAQAALAAVMRDSAPVAETLRQSAALMRKHLGRELPLIVSEFGMGIRGGAKILPTQATAVLVADMLREYLESPSVFAANRWCLYENHLFTSICGPSRGQERPYRARPDWGVFAIYAACRGAARVEIAGQNDNLKAVLFDRGDSYGLVLINRGAETFAFPRLELPAVREGRARLLLQTAAHALTGTENDRELARLLDTTFDYKPSEAIPLPPNSVAGLVLMKK